MRRATLLGLVALIHFYIGWRLLSPFHGVAAWWPSALGLTLLFALLTTTTARIFSHRDDRPLLLWLGLLGVGFFSSLFVLTLLRDATLLVAELAQSLGVITNTDAWRRDTAVAVPVLAAIATLLGLLNARRPPAIRRVTVPIDHLPDALNGFSIAQISDLHVGPTIRRRFVQTVVDRVNRLNADLIAVTGDVVDGPVPALRDHASPLAQLQARHGVFAVTGNHEYYSGAHAWIHEMQRLGMRVLMNEHVVITHRGATLLLAGVPDYSAEHFDRAHRSDPQAAQAGAPTGLRPRVLLAHQPRTAPAAAAAGFDLQLSGHTHGGQFWPWNLFVPLQQPYVAGLHRHEGMWIYTSRGTGYWGPPKRLGAPSEITLLRLVRA